MDTIGKIKDITTDDYLETNLIEKKLSKDKFLKTQYNLEESKVYDKSDQKLCVFDYNSELKDAEEYVENFIETKTLEISNNSDFRVIGWNKNSIFFLKE
jgi:hypothetical protein